MTNLSVIIPCAGFGTRVGMKPHESKELLMIEDENYPIIQHALDVCKNLDAIPIVISRKEKKDLNNYLKEQGVKPRIIDPKGEWMHTVYESEDQWSAYNILMLPDTRWWPIYSSLYNITFAVRDMNAPMAFAMHEVENYKKWCVRSADGRWMMEKPTFGGTKWAFGLIAWQYIDGSRFFHDLSEDKCAEIPANSQFTYLHQFMDITRGDMPLTNKYK